MSRGWWQDEQFWRDLGPFLFPERSFQYARDELEELLEQLELEAGARILDAGCGPGRYLLPLMQAGFEVVGFDACADYRRQARVRGAKLGLNPDVRAIDGFDFKLDERGSFDAVIDIFALLGYHQDPVADVVLIKTFLQALKPGGQLLIQARNPEHTRGSISHRSPSGGICTEDRRYDPDSRTMVTTWTILSGGRQRVYRSAVRVYRPEDIRGLLEFCEFDAVEVFDLSSEERVLATAMRPV